MPLYYFTVKAWGQTLVDEDGVDLPSDDAARAYGAAVAKELMRNRERETRFCSLVVCDDYLQPRFEVFFATLDKTIANLPPSLMVSVEQVCATVGQLRKAMRDIESSFCDLRTMLAQADKLLNRPWGPER